MLSRAPDTYLVHEYLEECNSPLYLSDFVERAAGHHLQYLGDAHTNSTAMEESDPHMAQLLAEAGDDVVKRLQYCDFSRNASFRQTLLCSADARLDHRGSTEIVRRMNVTGSLTPDPKNAQMFAHPSGGYVVTDVPLAQAALVHLGKIFPQGIAFEELCRIARPAALDDSSFASQVQGLAAELLDDWKMGLVELTDSLPVFAVTAGEKPKVSALARYFARTQNVVPTLRHTMVGLDDDYRNAIGLIDGTRTTLEIARDTISRDYHRPDGERLSPDEIRIGTDAMIRHLGQLALLEA